MRESDREWHYRYVRMSKERFDHLLGLLREKITKRDTYMREAISAEERLVITLRYLSAGMSQQTFCDNFRVGWTTVCVAIYDVLCPIYMNCPPTEKDWKHITDDFEELWDMPHILGAIDGKHIGMDCPKKSGTNYHNYKDFFSLVLLAVCDVHYNFTFVDVGQYGSNNDSSVLKESVSGKAFEQHFFNYPAAKRIPGCRLDKVPCFLVGDEIFPLKDWLMRPSPGKLDEASNIFNYRLSRARRFIENAFGILVARWRIFRGFIRATIRISSTLYAKIFILHESGELGVFDTAQWSKIVGKRNCFLNRSRVSTRDRM